MGSRKGTGQTISPCGAPRLVKITLEASRCGGMKPFAQLRFQSTTLETADDSRMHDLSSKFRKKVYSEKGPNLTKPKGRWPKGPGSSTITVQNPSACKVYPTATGCAFKSLHSSVQSTLFQIVDYSDRHWLGYIPLIEPAPLD